MLRDPSEEAVESIWETLLRWQGESEVDLSSVSVMIREFNVAHCLFNILNDLPLAAGNLIQSEKHLRFLLENGLRIHFHEKLLKQAIYFTCGASKKAEGKAGFDSSTKEIFLTAKPIIFRDDDFEPYFSCLDDFLYFGYDINNWNFFLGLLNCACENGNVEALETFLYCHADAREGDAFRSTPMYSAVLHVINLKSDNDLSAAIDRLKSMICLLRQVGEVNFEQLNAENAVGFRASILPAMYECGDEKYLAILHAILTVFDSEEEKSRILNATDKSGCTQLHLAILGKKESLVLSLLQLGADPNIPDRKGTTPLMSARKRQMGETVSLLVQYGAT